MRATEDLLEVRPLHELTVGQILEVAGVSRRTFYVHFASKYEVVAALLKRTLDEVMAGAEPYLQAQGQPVATALRNTLDSSASAWSAHAALMNSVIENMHAVPRLKILWQQYSERFVEAIAGRIEADRADGVAPAGLNAAALAVGFVATGERLFYMATKGGDPRLKTVSHAVDILYAMWLGAVYGQSWPSTSETASVRGGRGHAPQN
jgi:TetR/AcrR family transcriptional regulator, ethionamide resistance regulator